MLAKESTHEPEKFSNKCNAEDYIITVIFPRKLTGCSEWNLIVQNATENEISEILKKYRTVAVIGMSKNSEKDAYRIPQYLIKNGFKVIPVNPSADEILGQKSYKRLTDVPETVEIVDVFRPSDDVPNYVEDILEKKPKVVWEQLGIHNPEAEEKIASAGIRIVFDRCLMQEHRKIAMSS